MGKKPKKGGKTSLGPWELLCHPLSITHTSLLLFGLPFILLSYLLDPSQISMFSPSVLPFAEIIIFFVSEAWGLRRMSGANIHVLFFFFYIVTCSLLVMLQLHGPFTELATAFSQVSPILPYTVDQGRFRHSL